MRPLLACTLLLSLLGAGAQALAADVVDTPIVVHPARGAVSMLEGAGGNIGVMVGPEGVLIVDDQFAPLAPKIRTAIEALGGGAPAWVLNTHWHADHTDGNKAFGPTAVVIAHHSVRARRAKTIEARGRTFEALPPDALPEVTFAEGLTVHLNGEEIRLIHYPAAHTDGDAVVWFVGSRVIHMGDIFFNQRFPFIDRTSGGSIDGVIRAVEATLTWAPPKARIIPGHGPLSDVAGLRAYLEMLKANRALVAERVAQGMSRKEAVAAGVPKRWAPLSWSFISTETWLGGLYDELAAAR